MKKFIDNYFKWLVKHPYLGRWCTFVSMVFLTTVIILLFFPDTVMSFWGGVCIVMLVYGFDFLTEYLYRKAVRTADPKDVIFWPKGVEKRMSNVVSNNLKGDCDEKVH